MERRFDRPPDPPAGRPTDHAKPSHHSKQPTLNPIPRPSRGEWYDLQHFNHPGGPVALALCVGRDGTALFESHHYLIEHKRLMSILSKFKVPPSIAQGLKTMDPRDDGAHYGECGGKAHWEGNRVTLPSHDTTPLPRRLTPPRRTPPHPRLTPPHPASPRLTPHPTPTRRLGRVR